MGRMAEDEFGIGQLLAAVEDTEPVTSVDVLARSRSRRLRAKIGRAHV